ncbi:MAG: response regulator transcription factor [Eubacterium sp.]|nr:response regulator transcription factor [Eubacterium sp.]MBR7060205.1 response regulator transcription factor [Eubacterium sp.]
MRILVVEDEYKLADLISSRLKKEKYEVDVSLDGEDGLYNAESGIYDLIILDVMLPKMNGFEILSEIREEGITSKVIMLTAKSMLEDKLTGLNGGANDYLTKPFHMDELIARVNIQLRKDEKNVKKDYIEYGDLQLNISSSSLSCSVTGESINVINKEFQLLEYFMNNPERILTKEQIYDKVWGYENESESNNLEAYLSFIRRKLKALESSVNIKAVRGMGYRMEKNNG